MLPARCALLLLLLLGPAAAGAAGDVAALAALGRSPRVDPGLVEALARDGSARIYVSLRDAKQRSQGRIDALLGEVPAGEIEVRRRFAGLPSFAAEATPAGVLALLTREPRARVGLDPPLVLAMNEAAVVTRIDKVRDLGFTGSGVTLAILDTGIDTGHADLSAQLVGQQCFCDDEAGPNGCCPNGLDTQSGAGAGHSLASHGTRVAGMAMSAGSESPEGAAPDASLISVRVTSASAGNSSDAIAALEWIRDNHSEVKAVNLSFGNYTTSPLPPFDPIPYEDSESGFAGPCDNDDLVTMDYADVVADLLAQGTLVVAATGNDGDTGGMLAPACVADVISVGATYDGAYGSNTAYGCTDSPTATDQVTCWSNSGTTTDLFAPGARLTMAAPTGGSGSGTGTSFSAPMVTGCIADLLQADPGATPAEIRAALNASPTLVTPPGQSMEYPRLDCRDALFQLVGPLPTASPPLRPALALLLLAAGLAFARSRR